MLHGVKMQVAFQELKSDGLFHLYRGVMPPFFQKTVKLSLMFGIYEQTRRILERYDFEPGPAKVISASLAGIVETIGMPLERVQTLLADRKYHKKFKNTYHAFKTLKSYGVAEYYRGYSAVGLKNTPSSMLYFLFKDNIILFMPEPKNQLQKTFYEFVTGAIIGVMNSLIFYPLTVSRVRMQSRLGGAHQDLTNVLLELYTERGGKIRYVYHGIFGHVIRSCMSWGVANAAYDQCKIVF